MSAKSTSKFKHTWYAFVDSLFILPIFKFVICLFKSFISFVLLVILFPYDYIVHLFVSTVNPRVLIFSYFLLVSLQKSFISPPITCSEGIIFFRFLSFLFKVINNYINHSLNSYFYTIFITVKF